MYVTGLMFSRIVIINQNSTQSLILGLFQHKCYCGIAPATVFQTMHTELVLDNVTVHASRVIQTTIRTDENSHSVPQCYFCCVFC